MSPPIFWRDPALPHVELRKVEDGRRVCYAPHAHAEWSIGAIIRGESTFVRGPHSSRVDAGTLVFINPHVVHACNPIAQRPWAYLMLYLDTRWLAALRHRLGLSATPEWVDLAPDVLRPGPHFDAFVALARVLLDPRPDAETKNARLEAFLHALLPQLAAAVTEATTPPGLRALADRLDAQCADGVPLAALCRQADLSPGHLIRSFKRHFGLTPHAYVINRRIQLGQRALRRGHPIAEAALESGFADQPHFQRTFKRLLAATPRQYRQGSIDEQEAATGHEQDGEPAVHPT